MQKEGADIRAVAARAGVSVASVSRFLNGKKRVRPETEARIQEAVSTLGYRPNPIAQSMRTNRTQLVGLILPDSSNPFFSALVRGAEDALGASGYALTLLNSNEDVTREQELLERLKRLRCDGVILIPAPETENELQRWEGHDPAFPLVVVDREAGIPTDLVAVDNALGGTLAATYLLANGHRRIGLLSVDYQVSSHRARRAGFVQALSEVGLTPCGEAFVPLTVEDGSRATKALLARDEPPTALFVTSSSLTIGALTAFQAQGLQCPRDISIVGYDSYPWQEILTPRLTVICQPAYEMGQCAAERLLARMQGADAAPQRQILPPTLIVRDSVLLTRSR